MELQLDGIAGMVWGLTIQCKDLKNGIEITLVATERDGVCHWMFRYGNKPKVYFVSHKRFNREFLPMITDAHMEMILKHLVIEDNGRTRIGYQYLVKARGDRLIG